MSIATPIHDAPVVILSVYPERLVLNEVKEGEGKRRISIGCRMSRDYSYYVYIMTNKSGTLYTGVTNDLARRVFEHKQKLVKGFTKRYNIGRLVYFEETNDINNAIAREKQIKGWLRVKKIALIESINPDWTDLSADWF